jgi:hypothetical protein
MMRPLLAAALALAAAVRAVGCGFPLDEELMTKAFSTDAKAARFARLELRAAGQIGLTFVDHQHRDRPQLGDEAAWSALYDEVGQQLGCRSSLLYWYTDLDQAEAEARRQHKPIVSLRLLGKLTDEYSCANSRFFRAALYADPEVSAWLREHVILHWSSERASAPQLAIDFGDGRTYRGTIGGNSAHFVLDAEGRAIDVLPGMYGPKPFLAALSAAEGCARALAADPARRDGILVAYHREALAREQIELREPTPIPSTRIADEDQASAAQVITESKGMVEAPVLDAIGQLDRDVPRPLPAKALQRLTRAHPEFGELSEPSRRIIAAQLDGLRALGAPVSIGPFPLMAVERAIVEDTAIDEFALHGEIHQRFVDGEAGDFGALDGWLYAEVFRTPASDPYLGLMPHAWDGLAHADAAVGGVTAAR